MRPHEVFIGRVELKRFLQRWEQGFSDTELIKALNNHFNLALPNPPEPPPWISDGFDAPVGTKEERAAVGLWPGTWFDATGFMTYYTAVGAAYHTGADLNNNTPKWDSDRDAPVYAAGHGDVIFADRLPGTWGNVIVIKHAPMADGKIVYTRYAHVQNMRVKEGDRVLRGHHIANVGNAFGQLAYHLHFDVVTTPILETNPGDWPGLAAGRITENYTDPRKFIAENRPAGTYEGTRSE